MLRSVDYAGHKFNYSVFFFPGDSWGKKSNEKTNICIDTCGVALSSGNAASM